MVIRMADSKKKILKTEENLRNERRFMIGPRLSFAAAESYKLLRTNVEADKSVIQKSWEL